jgi:hypothetical protein
MIFCLNVKGVFLIMSITYRLDQSVVFFLKPETAFALAEKAINRTSIRVAIIMHLKRKTEVAAGAKKIYKPPSDTPIYIPIVSIIAPLMQADME